jgi:alkylation response protein AidB-like acyl-CoA dehydrogenase
VIEHPESGPQRDGAYGVNFAFTEEQQELRATARAFLAEASKPEAVRAATESALGYDAKLWAQIGGELGWTGVVIPEGCGGLGLSWVELVALQEVIGETLAPGPFFASVCLAANAILAAGDPAQQEALLSGIAEGRTRGALALTEANGRWDADGIATTCTRDGADTVLRGEKRYVIDGATADVIVLAARAPNSSGGSGVSLFALPASTPGIGREAVATLDATRRMATLKLDGVRVPESARLGAEGAAWPALETALQRAAVALAAEQLGGAQRALDLAVAYAKQRVQFGRAIGSFQGLKHELADVMVSVEAARSAVYYAGCVAASGGRELPAAASMAKAAATEAFSLATATALQVFGGVGFTWEYDVHLYFKRARSSATLLGDASWHRERVARAIGL